MFGKILVMLHLGLSLTFATWALVLFTNRIDWTNKKGTGTQSDGELVARMADYDRLAKSGVRPADARFREARKKAHEEELGRPLELAWFKIQEEFLKSGATEANPVRQIDRDANNNPIVIANAGAGDNYLQMGPIKDKDGQPSKNRDGQPLVLKSLDFYNGEYNILLTQESAFQLRRISAAKRDLAATEQLKDGPDGKPMGLHSKIRFETAKKDKVEDEYAEIRPLWLNTAVELKNLEELRTRLQIRLDELNKVKNKGDKQGQ